MDFADDGESTLGGGSSSMTSEADARLAMESRNAGSFWSASDWLVRRDSSRFEMDLPAGLGQTISVTVPATILAGADA